MNGPWDLPLGWAIATAIAFAISICTITVETAKITVRKRSTTKLPVTPHR